MYRPNRLECAVMGFLAGLALCVLLATLVLLP